MSHILTSVHLGLQLVHGGHGGASCSSLETMVRAQGEALNRSVMSSEGCPHKPFPSARTVADGDKGLSGSTLTHFLFLLISTWPSGILQCFLVRTYLRNKFNCNVKWKDRFYCYSFILQWNGKGTSMAFLSLNKRLQNRNDYWSNNPNLNITKLGPFP